MTTDKYIKTLNIILTQRAQRPTISTAVCSQVTHQPVMDKTWCDNIKTCSKCPFWGVDTVRHVVGIIDENK